MLSRCLNLRKDLDVSCGEHVAGATQTGALLFVTQVPHKQAPHKQVPHKQVVNGSAINRWVEQLTKLAAIPLVLELRNFLRQVLVDGVLAAAFLH